MKKDRNCGGNITPYPMYPAYPGMMMNQGMMPQGIMPMPNMPMNTMAPNTFNTTPSYMTQMSTSSGSIEQQLSNLTNQVNSLERRIMSLESLVGSPTSKYNNSNYQVM